MLFCGLPLNPLLTRSLFGHGCEKICLRRFTNNKGADQPAHTRSLISPFVIRFLESIVSKLATSKISIFSLISVDEQAGLNLTLLETLKTGFLAMRPVLKHYITLHVLYVSVPEESFCFRQCRT